MQLSGVFSLRPNPDVKCTSALGSANTKEDSTSLLGERLLCIAPVRCRAKFKSGNCVKLSAALRNSREESLKP